LEGNDDVQHSIIQPGLFEKEEKKEGRRNENDLPNTFPIPVDIIILLLFFGKSYRALKRCENSNLEMLFLC
jgi:hypothetical protein